MGQKLTILRIRKTPMGDNTYVDDRPNILMVNRNSIGRMTWNNKVYKYNMHLVATNVIDFEKETTPNAKKTIFVTRK